MHAIGSIGTNVILDNWIFGGIQLIYLVPIQFKVVPNWLSWCQFDFGSYPTDEVGANVILGDTRLVQLVRIWFLVAPIVNSVGDNVIFGGTRLIHLALI